jgi:hypothetical protein
MPHGSSSSASQHASRPQSRVLDRGSVSRPHGQTAVGTTPHKPPTGAAWPWSQPGPSGRLAHHSWWNLSRREVWRARPHPATDQGRGEHIQDVEEQSIDSCSLVDLTALDRIQSMPDLHCRARGALDSISWGWGHAVSTVGASGTQDSGRWRARGLQLLGGVGIELPLVIIVDLVSVVIVVIGFERRGTYIWLWASARSSRNRQSVPHLKTERRQEAEYESATRVRLGKPRFDKSFARTIDEQTKSNNRRTIF